jgi:ParB family chromosome partitioning protein
MAERKGGLGRGLAALIPTGPGIGADATPRPGMVSMSVSGRPLVTPRDSVGAMDERGVAGTVYRELEVAAIRPNPHQPRTTFDEDALAELEHSIREFGLLQPVVVREAPSGYELVMGERRWRAAQQAGLDRIPAIVRQTGDDAMLRDALLENIHRVQLNPLEEAAAYEQLLAEFGVTHHELAARLGRSRPAITNTIRLLKLPVAVQRRIAVGVLAAGHARALLGLDDSARQEELAARIVAEGMSVRATEEAVLLARQANPGRQRSSRRRPSAPPGVQELADKLSDTYETKVKVQFGSGKGRIVVEFGSAEDLERIVSMMTPSTPA